MNNMYENHLTDHFDNARPNIDFPFTFEHVKEQSWYMTSDYIEFFDKQDAEIKYIQELEQTHNPKHQRKHLTFPKLPEPAQLKIINMQYTPACAFVRLLNKVKLYELKYALPSEQELRNCVDGQRITHLSQTGRRKCSDGGRQ